MSRLIVNADDLGYTAGVDRAIFSLASAAAVSSATAMARGSSLPDSLANRPASLAVGCHVVLVDGEPSAPAAEVQALLQHGRFRPTLGRFVLDLERGAIREDEIEREATAQIRSLQTRGLRVTHVDTHKHTHVFPRVLRPLLRAAANCGVRAVRNPFEPEWARAAALGAPAARRLQLRLLSVYRSGFLRQIRDAGMRSTADALGVLATGTLDAPTLERLLGALERHGAPEECYELVCHPGFHDAALEGAGTRLKAERERERTALLEVVPRWTGAGAPHRLSSFAEL